MRIAGVEYPPDPDISADAAFNRCFRASHSEPTEFAARWLHEHTALRNRIYRISAELRIVWFFKPRSVCFKMLLPRPGGTEPTVETLLESVDLLIDIAQTLESRR